MNIYYNSIGIPSIDIDGYLYRFLVDDSNIIISELSVNPEAIEEISKIIIDNINSLSESFININYETSYEDILLNRQVLDRVFQLIKCFEVLSEARAMSLMFSTENPYPSWRWDNATLSWEAPIVYPSTPGDGIYIWDETELSWTPLEISPYPSWVWNNQSISWEPPMKYPLDAGENDFYWDENNTRWAANV